MSSLEANLARYEQLIPPLHHTQMALWQRVDEEMMRAACAVMTTATRCHFMPRDEDSIVTMLNYCCFNVVFRDGRNLVEVHVTEHPPENDDERAVLQAHQRSHFSVFEVLQLVPRLGVQMRDLFTDETSLVVYPRLAETLDPGLLLSIRVMPLEDFHVPFNGPVSVKKVASVPRHQESLFQAYAKFGVQKGQPLTAEQRGTIETFQTIDMLSQRYPELLPSHIRRPSPAPPPPASRFGQEPPPTRMNSGRNDPCPCGSGKKFKHCCLRRN